jgi:hypothetical protein
LGLKLREAVSFESVEHGLNRLCDLVMSQSNTYALPYRDIPHKSDTFHVALHDLLEEGARVVEKLIAKNRYNRLRLEVNDHDERRLVDYVHHRRGINRRG